MELFESHPMPVHIRPQSPTGQATAPFILNDREVPSQLFRAYVAGDSFDENRQFWISKDGGTTKEPCRIENVEFKDYPDGIAQVGLDLDSELTYQQYRLYAGNTGLLATEIQPDTSSNRRWSILISVG